VGASVVEAVGWCEAAGWEGMRNKRAVAVAGFCSKCSSQSKTAPDTLAEAFLGVAML